MFPKLWADFNARGYSGDSDDNCCYAFPRDQLQKLGPTPGMKVLLYMDDEKECVVCEATMELYDGGWRARPDETTWHYVPTKEFLSD